MVKVLVIDDYQEHVDTLVNTLNMYGCDARGVNKGHEGLVLAQTWQPQLVVCDGLLEGMHAWQFGHKILEQNPAHRPYLVALTGNNSTLQRRLCEECGYDEYVTKPIELATLLDWVHKARERTEQPHAS